MRERVQTLFAMAFVLVVFTGCKGMGALVKVAAVALYVGARVAIAAAAAHHESGPPPDPPAQECGCAPVQNGKTWCERQEGEDRCVLQCESGYLYRDGLCVPDPDQGAAVVTAAPVNASP